MKIGIAGPMTLRLLDFDFQGRTNVPVGYDHSVISLLINALLRRGHKVVAFTNSVDIEKPIVYEGNRLTICIARCRQKHKARDFYAFERRDLTRLMRDYPVDILNAHWSYEFAYAALEAGLPSLVTLHDHALTVLRYARDPYRFVRLLMNYSVLSKAQYLSANSPYLYSRLSERNKKKTRTIPNFYTEFLEQCSARPVAKSSFVLSVSNGFSRFKNIGTALKAFSIIRKRKPDIEYHLIGDNMEVGGLAYEYAVRNRVTDGVQFLGRLEFEEVTRKIRQALVLLHPSREESFGSILLEAMVLGTPVVGGHSSGNVPYLLDNGRAGVLSDVNSAQETAKAVLTVLEDVELARSLVERAKRFAEKNFSEDVILQAYTTYYHDIVDRSSRPGMA